MTNLIKRTILCSLIFLWSFTSVSHAASCSLSSSVTSQLNTLLAPYETRLRNLSASEAKGKIDTILPRLQTLKGLARFMDSASVCMIDTVSERLSQLSSLSCPIVTCSGEYPYKDTATNRCYKWTWGSCNNKCLNGDVNNCLRPSYSNQGCSCAYPVDFSPAYTEACIWTPGKAYQPGQNTCTPPTTNPNSIQCGAPEGWSCVISPSTISDSPAGYPKNVPYNINSALSYIFRTTGKVVHVHPIQFDTSNYGKYDTSSILTNQFTYNVYPRDMVISTIPGSLTSSNPYCSKKGSSESIYLPLSFNNSPGTCTLSRNTQYYLNIKQSADSGNTMDYFIKASPSGPSSGCSAPAGYTCAMSPSSYAHFTSWKVSVPLDFKWGSRQYVFTANANVVNVHPIRFDSNFTYTPVNSEIDVLIWTQETPSDISGFENRGRTVVISDTPGSMTPINLTQYAGSRCKRSVGWLDTSIYITFTKPNTPWFCYLKKDTQYYLNFKSNTDVTTGPGFGYILNVHGVQDTSSASTTNNSSCYAPTGFSCDISPSTSEITVPQTSSVKLDSNSAHTFKFSAQPNTVQAHPITFSSSFWWTRTEMALNFQRLSQNLGVREYIISDKPGNISPIGGQSFCKIEGVSLGGTIYITFGGKAGFCKLEKDKSYWLNVKATNPGYAVDYLVNPRVF